MAEPKSIITKSHGNFTCLIDNDLQKNNPLAVRGIYLVEVSNGVAWGYDSDKYELDSDLSFKKKEQ